MNTFKFGDAVWRTTGHRKFGRFQGLVRHTAKHRGPQLCYVMFKGNRYNTVVPVIELMRTEQRTADHDCHAAAEDGCEGCGRREV